MDFSDLLIGVLLLTDMHKNFRDMGLKTYDLNHSYHYTVPRMSFDCMLKYTSVQLELLHDYDMLLFFENGVRGGLTQAIKR